MWDTSSVYNAKYKIQGWCFFFFLSVLGKYHAIAFWFLWSIEMLNYSYFVPLKGICPFFFLAVFGNIISLFYLIN